MKTPFDPDETQKIEPLRLPPSPSGVIALDADDPANKDLADGYMRSAVLLTIQISERGRVHLTGVDWGAFPVTPGRYSILVELEPV